MSFMLRDCMVNGPGFGARDDTHQAKRIVLVMLPIMSVIHFIHTKAASIMVRKLYLFD